MRVKVGVITAVLAVLVSAHAQGAERIDRVLAVVNGTTITESDVRAALAFGLVRAPRPEEDQIRTTLEQLIRRELILGEVARSIPADVDAGRVAARMDEIRTRFASRAAYDAKLAETAMSETRLRDDVEANMRVDAYLAQRFGAVAEPGDAEIAAYYDAHRGEFTSGGREQTLEEAKPAVRARIVEERRRQAVDDWVARLRRRAEVTDLYFAAVTRVRWVDPLRKASSYHAANTTYGP